MRCVTRVKRAWKLTKNPEFWMIAVVLLFGLLAGRGLIGKGYFNMHDDLQMMRQLQMEKCFLDGQIPCRWVPDMGYGFGYPLFNFYPPLPYLVGELWRAVGYTFVDTIKILFIMSIIFSGLAMYGLAREFYGPSEDEPGRLGGIIAAVFYIWAPYHAVDIYVRGAMNEAWALIWFPLILWSGYRLTVEKNKILKWVVVLALAWFGLFTSHNLMVLIFTPLFAGWCLMWIIRGKNWRNIPWLVLAGAWSFGLSAFFTVPVLMEKGKVATDTLVVGYYEYTAHFADIKQILFSRFWGYGPSVWMAMDDGMSFQIGWVHWGLAAMIGIAMVGRVLKKKRVDNLAMVSLFFVGAGWIAAFMVHPRSTPVWQMIDSLRFVQFPWRFLTMVILAFSMAAGAVVKLLPRGWAWLLGLVLVGAVVGNSWNYFLPEYKKLGPLTDEEKFYGLAWDLQQTAGIYDYLPKAAKTAPKEPRRTVAEVVRGEGKVITGELGSDWAKMAVEMETEGVLRINIIDFPTWRVFVDGERAGHFVPGYEDWGRIHVELAQGKHEVEAKLFNTWPRTMGNAVSLGAWICLGVVGYTRRRKISE